MINLILFLVSEIANFDTKKNIRLCNKYLYKHVRLNARKRIKLYITNVYVWASDSRDGYYSYDIALDKENSMNKPLSTFFRNCEFAWDYKIEELIRSLNNNYNKNSYDILEKLFGENLPNIHYHINDFIKNGFINYDVEKSLNDEHKKIIDKKFEEYIKNYLYEENYVVFYSTYGEFILSIDEKFIEFPFITL